MGMRIRLASVVAGALVLGGIAGHVCGPVVAYAAASPTASASSETTPSEETTPQPPADATMTVLAVGDLMVHRGQLSVARAGISYNFAPSLRPVEPVISAADIAVGNLETTLRGSGFSGYPAFRSPRSFARALQDAGFDVLTTANNHTLDGGAYGVRYTSDYLDSLGIAHTGSNRAGPAIVEHDGVKIAFLAYTYATNGIHSPFSGAVNRIKLATMKHAIAAARAQADLVVVCPHWGTEYSRGIEKSTRAKARALIDAGADIILGSHPHVVRPIEKYKGHYIVYSMGNFLSGMSKPYTDLGIMVDATVTRAGGVTSVASLRVLPVYRDMSSGRGSSAFRTVLISSALKPGASMISTADRRRMRSYLRYCKRVYGSLL
jgi:poly-gamma-glutamate capsule biosynthesis protein CapA/YwtB (metallophosphatase superfamily)